MSNRIAIITALCAGALTGCVVHEPAYTTTPAYASVQTGYGYPLYYADGVYWAYRANDWYWWNHDHWLMSTHAPASPVVIRPGHGYTHRGYAPSHHSRASTHHRGTSHRGVRHGGSHHGSHRGSHR